jgi:hypothetical protein
VTPGNLHTIRKIILCLAITWYSGNTFASPPDSIRSTIQEAIEYLNSQPQLDSSASWPNISPVYFRENLDQYLNDPLHAFESKYTNFCGYTAISFATIRHDPLGFIKFMLQLYKDGKAKMGDAMIEPSKAVRDWAGKLKYKGTLDINPATQMWFMSLADHFKGYLNLFNKRYDPGDENRMWASTNFAKFNRMLRKLLGWKVHGRGADLVRPPINDLYGFIEDKLTKGTVFLYLNNRLLYKKKHVSVTRKGIPTHYVLLESISKYENKINIVYVDGGRKTLQQVDPWLLQKIIFGITWCTEKKDSD